MICAALHENRLFSSLFCSFACWWSFVEQDWWLFTVSSDRCESMDSTLQVGIELKRCFYVGLALFQCFPTFCNWFTFWTNYCKIIYSRYCCVPLHHFRARSNFLGIPHQWGLPWTSVILCCDFSRGPQKSKYLKDIQRIQALVMATKHNAKKRWIGRSLISVHHCEKVLSIV